MRKIGGKRIPVQFPPDLWSRVEAQRKKEKRTLAEFIRRVVDRYLLEQEFRGDLSPEAEASIKENKELLKLLRNA